MPIETTTRSDGSKRCRSTFKSGGNRYISPWFADEETAKEWEARKRVDIFNGIEVTGAALTLSAFAEIWLEKHSTANTESGTSIKSAQHLAKWVLPDFGNTPISKIRSTDLIFHFSRLRTKTKDNGRPVLAPKSIRNIIGTVKQMFRHAVEWGFISTNPAATVPQVKAHTAEVTFFTREEMNALLSHCRDRLPDLLELVSFAVNTGCRLGECCGLRWDRVDLKGEHCTIAATWDQAVRQTAERTKGKRFRRIPLNSEALTLLRAMHLDGRSQEDSRVFSRINYHWITDKGFWRVMKAAGLTDAIRRRATFHTLRHTFASEFMRAGGNLFTLQKILGHATIAQTEKYAHFAPDFLAGETERVSFSAPGGKVLAFSPAKP